MVSVWCGGRGMTKEELQRENEELKKLIEDLKKKIDI